MALGSRQWVYFLLRALKSGNCAKTGTWLTTPARIAGVGHGHRGRPAPSAGHAALGAGVSQQAHPPSGRCTCASGVHLRFQGAPGVSGCTCGIQASSSYLKDRLYFVGTIPTKVPMRAQGAAAIGNKGNLVRSPQGPIR
jgi:hypothetical protein